MHLRQGRLPLYSPDPDYAPKLDRRLRCLREAAQTPEEVVVLFLDEMGYFRWPDAAPDWAEVAPVKAPEARRAGPNNRPQRLIGALNARTGQVDYLDNYVVGRKQVIAFYGRLNQIYAQARRICVIQDNWSIHQHPDVLTALIQWPRLEPVWLPTYAPPLEPDRETLALVASGCAQTASAGRGLACLAPTSTGVSGSICHWVA